MNKNIILSCDLQFWQYHRLKERQKDTEQGKERRKKLPKEIKSSWNRERKIMFLHNFPTIDRMCFKFFAYLEQIHRDVQRIGNKRVVFN